ncbi:MAG: hypothetical protein MI784_18030 [Cytophagales bacterium]|nr:hypothetical protein [Cytophagales bacterium]
MKRYFVLLFVACFFTLQAQAQKRSQKIFPSEVWHPGQLVLMEGDTLNAQLKYDFKTETVLLKFKGNVFSYNSRKILFFNIHDITSDSFREFFSLPYYVKPNYKVPILFEVLYEGPLTLLSREAIVEDQIVRNSYYQYGTAPYRIETTKRLAFDYFFLDMDGTIKPFRLRKKDLLRVMRKHSSAIKRYIKQNKLKLSKQEDLIRIVSHYNELMGMSVRR